MEKMEPKYNTIKLPTEIIYEVDRYMDTHKHEGFTTRVEVIKTALRNFLNNNSNKNYQPNDSEEKKMGISEGDEERTQPKGGTKHESLDNSGRSPQETTSDTLRLHDKQNQPQRTDTTRTPDQKRETQKEKMKGIGSEEPYEI